MAGQRVWLYAVGATIFGQCAASPTLSPSATLIPFLFCILCFPLSAAVLPAASPIYHHRGSMCHMLAPLFG